MICISITYYLILIPSVFVFISISLIYSSICTHFHPCISFKQGLLISTCSTAKLLNSDDAEAADNQRASTARLRQLTSHQKVRQLIRDRELSAEDRRLPALAVKSCSSNATKTGGKYERHVKAHCEFELRHKLEEQSRTGSLPNIHWSQSTVANTNSNNSNGLSSMTIRGSGKHIPLSGVPHLELTTRLRSLDGVEPEVRDNINVVMLKFIRQARESIEKSKENRRKVELASSCVSHVRSMGKCVDITMKPKQKNQRNERIATIPHRRLGEVKGRLIKSR